MPKFFINFYHKKYPPVRENKKKECINFGNTLLVLVGWKLTAKRLFNYLVNAFLYDFIDAILFYIHAYGNNNLKPDSEQERFDIYIYQLITWSWTFGCVIFRRLVTTFTRSSNFPGAKVQLQLF